MIHNLKNTDELPWALSAEPLSGYKQFIFKGLCNVWAIRRHLLLFPLRESEHLVFLFAKNYLNILPIIYIFHGSAEPIFLR